MGIITCPGCCLGMEANIRPIAAKQKADRTIPAIKATMFVMVDWKNSMAIIMGIEDTNSSEMKRETVLSSRNVVRDIGTDK
jgi:hypothetical protein